MATAASAIDASSWYSASSSGVLYRLLKQREDRLRHEIVGHDFPAQFLRQIGFVERQRHSVSQTNAEDLHDVRPERERKLPCDGLACRNDLLVQQPRRRMPTLDLHVLDKAGEFRQFLRDSGLGNKRPLAPANFDEALPHEVLDRRPDGSPADVELADEAFFRRQLMARWKRAACDAFGERVLDLDIERQAAGWIVRHSDIMMS